MIETVRPGGSRQVFAMMDRGGYLESIHEVPEPHAFTALVRLNHSGERRSSAFRQKDRRR
jgi:nickel/cobalt exporter